MWVSKKTLSIQRIVAVKMLQVLDNALLDLIFRDDGHADQPPQSLVSGAARMLRSRSMGSTESPS